METIGIRELKTHLSTYVDRARSGELIIVTDRGREVAELGPLSSERRLALELVGQGRARWSGGKPVGMRGVRVKRGPISDTVIEDRREL